MMRITSRILPAGPWRTGLLVALIVVGVWSVMLCSPFISRILGIGDSAGPFIDLYGLLAAGELAQAHGNPFQPNPLDHYNRPHVYTTWWLVTGSLGLTRADTAHAGAALVILTLGSALCLIRPRRLHEATFTLAVLCSPALLFAANRANNDLAVFVLMCGALATLRANVMAARALAVVLLAIAAALKYFPLAALVVLLGVRSRRELLGGIGLFALVLLLAWPALSPGLESAARYKPNPDGLYAFGAPVLFRNFGIYSSFGWLALTGVVAVAGFALARSQWPDALTTTEESIAEREFVCGAALIVGCFFLGATYAYKMIFAVWLLPWLWTQHDAIPAEPWRRFTMTLLLIVLWFEGLMAIVINVVFTPLSVPAARHLLNAILAINQVLTWSLILALVRELLIYANRRLQVFATREGGRVENPVAVMVDREKSQQVRRRGQADEPQSSQSPERDLESARRSKFHGTDKGETGA